jgi:hypothetical protein
MNLYRGLAICQQRWRWLWDYYPNALCYPWDDDA